MPSNFRLLDKNLPEVAVVMTAMMQAREAVGRRSWSHPHEPTSEDWWADVLADPRARRRERRTDMAVKTSTRNTGSATSRMPLSLLPVPSADGERSELIAAHGADCPLPSLLDKLAAPGCTRIGSFWDRCGVYYVEPIERV